MTSSSGYRDPDGRGSYISSRAGPVALVGGDELNPGNEPQDEVLVAAASGGPANVLATAAGRQRPDLGVRNARAWFKGLGLDVDCGLVRGGDGADADHEVVLTAAG